MEKYLQCRHSAKNYLEGSIGGKAAGCWVLGLLAPIRWNRRRKKPPVLQEVGTRKPEGCTSWTLKKSRALQESVECTGTRKQNPSLLQCLSSTFYRPSFILCQLAKKKLNLNLKDLDEFSQSRQKG